MSTPNIKKTMTETDQMGLVVYNEIYPKKQAIV